MKKRVVTPRTLEQLRDCFWKKVDIGGPTDCWLWNGKRDENGYGRLRFRKRQVRTHRVAFLLEYGELPKGAFICHHCNTPGCVNPKHLYAGTHLMNVQDSWRRGVRRSSMLGKVGDLSPNHKLTAAQVSKIFLMVKARGMPQTQAARLFSVDTSAISNIIRGKRWRPK